MRLRSLLLVVAALVVAESQAADPRAPIVVARTTTPVKVDGNLNEASWKAAQAYKLGLPVSATAEGKTVEEPGTVRLLHDGATLWLGFDFEDSDVVSNAKADDEELYALGDVAEIFLRAAVQTGYWEIHLNPKNQRSTYWYPGRGRLGLKGEDSHVRPPFWTAAALVEGTLNDWRDRDRRWTAEAAIPLAKLRREGDPDPFKGGWTILVARYNYTRYRQQATGPELTCVPPVSKPSYHLLEDYAPLQFER